MPTHFPSTDYVPAPPGKQHAVCVDIIDKGEVTSTWGTRLELEIRWQTAARMPDGKPYLVVKSYRFSRHEKSTLRLHLGLWRGTPFTDAELKNFDLEKLIGKNCILTLDHKFRTDGSSYARVIHISPSLKSLPVLAPIGYIRKAAQQGVATHAMPAPQGDFPDTEFEVDADSPEPEEEIPF
jgi:hypothetical protein